MSEESVTAALMRLWDEEPKASEDRWAKLRKLLMQRAGLPKKLAGVLATLLNGQAAANDNSILDALTQMLAKRAYRYMSQYQVSLRTGKSASRWLHIEIQKNLNSLRQVLLSDLKTLCATSCDEIRSCMDSFSTLAQLAVNKIQEKQPQIKHEFIAGVESFFKQLHKELQRYGATD